MTDPARPAAGSPTPLPDLILYTRDGCHLCDDARAIVTALLDQRRTAGLPSPTLLERDITTSDDWQRAFLATIPVLELADRRLELATSVSGIRRFLDDALATAGARTP